jgi:3-oxoacyl-[acyl-carrier protein] reductase
VVQSIKAAGGQAFAVYMDLNDDKSLDQAVETVARQWGTVHILVNSAGDFPEKGPFELQLNGEIERALRANYIGPARLIQRVIPFMRKQQWGRIVSISTVHVPDGAPITVPHAAAKSALHGMTKSLSKALAADGIMINLILPALTPNARTEQHFGLAHLEQVAAKHPSGRNSTPEEVGRFITFLCSGANSRVNGEFIRIAGGF